MLKNKVVVLCGNAKTWDSIILITLMVPTSGRQPERLVFPWLDFFFDERQNIIFKNVLLLQFFHNARVHAKKFCLLYNIEPEIIVANTNI